MIARHDPVLRFDLQKRRLWIEASSTAALDRLTQQLASVTEQPKGKPPSIPLTAWHHHTSADHYATGVQRIRDLIAAGDLFQANLTACCSTAWPKGGNALELFVTLREACPAPFAGLIISDQNEALLSSSPERFLQVSAEEPYKPGRSKAPGRAMATPNRMRISPRNSCAAIRTGPRT